MRYRIERSGNLCSIKPWKQDLAGVLSFFRMERAVGKNGKARMKRVGERLYSVQDSVGYFPGGVLHRVIEALKGSSDDVEYIDFRDMASLKPDPSFERVEPLRAGQPEVLATIASSDCGIIVCNTGWGKSFLIKQICAMYPSLKIVVASPGRSEILNIYERLEPFFPTGTVGLIGCGRHDSPERRIICTTAASILGSDLKGCDLLLFDEVHACGYNKLAESLKWVQDARMFGFTASPEGRHDGCEMIMEAFFGPIIADFDYGDSVKKGTATPIEVWMYEVQGPLLNQNSDVSKKRWGFWRNNNRNMTVAEIARKVIPAEDQTLVMVETVEHAMYLKRAMPEFELVYGNITNDSFDDYKEKGFVTGDPVTSKQRTALRKRFESGELLKVIATGVWKQAVDFEHLKWLIRCDGATSPIRGTQIPGRLSRLSADKKVGILIDFCDGFDPWASRKAQKRMKHYSSMGWKVIKKGALQNAY